MIDCICVIVYCIHHDSTFLISKSWIVWMTSKNKKSNLDLLFVMHNKWFSEKEFVYSLIIVCLCENVLLELFVLQLVTYHANMCLEFFA